MSRGARRHWTSVDRGWLVVVVAVAVATGLALYHLSTKSLWYDETFSIDIARLAPGDMLDTLVRREANGTVHYLALSIWRLLGETEARIRFLSVLCVVATIPLLYLIGRRHLGVPGAAVGCLLFAIHPFVITYAQDGRMYAMAMLAVTAAVLAWSYATTTDRRAAWAAYGALGVLALYTHFFCGFVLLGLGITWLLGVVPRTRRGLVAQAVIVITGLALLPLIVATDFDQVAWIRPFSEAGVAAVLGITGTGVPILAAVLYGLALLAIPTRDTARLRALAPLVAWAVTPFVAGIVVSLYRSLLEGRYFIVALPAVLLLAGAGVVRIASVVSNGRARVVVVAACLVLVVALVIAPLSSLYTAERWDWRGAARWVAQTAKAGDRVTYIDGDGRSPFRFYLDRVAPTAVSDASVDEIRSTSGRTWLVLYLRRDVRYDGLEATFPGYDLIESKFFQGVRVQLIERK